MVEHKHPITPPPELVQQWWEEADKQLSSYYDYIATQAARWGAEEALVACERSAFGIPGDRDTIRRALERLKELEKGNE